MQFSRIASALRMCKMDEWN